MSWKNIEPQEGVFRWKNIDSLIQKAVSYGKKVSITILPGEETPEWVYTKGARKFDFINRNIYDLDYGKASYCPMPWDPIFLTEWKKMIDALGARYSGNPIVSWVRITGPMNTAGGDWTLQAKEDWDKYIGTADEFSDEKLIAAVEDVIDYFATAFPSKPLPIAISNTKITDNPPYHTAANAVTNYGFATYPNQFLIQNNGWSAYIPLPNKEDPDMDLFKTHVPYTGTQMVWSASNDPSCRMNGRISPCDPYTSFNGAIELAKIYQLSFIEVYAADVLNSDLQTILGSFYQ